MFKILSDLKYQIDGEVTLDDPAEMKNTRRFLVRNAFDQDRFCDIIRDPSTSSKKRNFEMVDILKAVNHENIVTLVTNKVGLLEKGWAQSHYSFLKISTGSRHCTQQ